MATIVTYADRFGERSLLEHAARNPSFLGDFTPPAPGIALDVRAVARVNGGRWCADCPTDGCGGAEFINPDDSPPLLFCCQCRNTATGHQPVVVDVPAAKKRAQIEAYLGARPAWQTRNWEPDETVKQLRDENREHDIRIEGGAA